MKISSVLNHLKPSYEFLKLTEQAFQSGDFKLKNSPDLITHWKTLKFLGFVAEMLCYTLKVE